MSNLMIETPFTGVITGDCGDLSMSQDALQLPLSTMPSNDLESALFFDEDLTNTFFDESMANPLTSVDTPTPDSHIYDTRVVSDQQENRKPVPATKKSNTKKAACTKSAEKTKTKTKQVSRPTKKQDSARKQASTKQTTAKRKRKEPEKPEKPTGQRATKTSKKPASKKKTRKQPSPPPESFSDEDIFDDDEDDFENDLDGEPLPRDPRKRRILERNRIAATKCRLRKRDEASALAEREQALEDQNRELTAYFNALTSEVYHLKTQILRHTDCNCVLIQKYIVAEAQKSVDKMVGGKEKATTDKGQATNNNTKAGNSNSTSSARSGDSMSPPPTASHTTAPTSPDLDGSWESVKDTIIDSGASLQSPGVESVQTPWSNSTMQHLSATTANTTVDAMGHAKDALFELDADNYNDAGEKSTWGHSPHILNTTPPGSFTDGYFTGMETQFQNYPQQHQQHPHQVLDTMSSWDPSWTFWR